LNRINFLPSTYVQQQARQNWVFKEAIWIGMTLVLIVGWFLTARGGLSELREYKASLSDAAEAAKGRKAEVMKLRSEQQAMLDKQKLQRKLVEPIRNSSLLSTISQLMPASIVLRDLDLSGNRPTPSTRSSNDANPEAPRAEKERPPEPVRIAMTGTAASDSEVANFVGKLSGNPVFSNVKMVFSRAAAGDSGTDREFRIELEVPLDRVFVLGDQPAKEVANAN